MGKAPIKRFKVGQVEIAVWENQIKTANEELKTVKNITIKKSYYDNVSKEWKDSSSFNSTDIAQLRILLEKAFCFMNELD